MNRRTWMAGVPVCRLIVAVMIGCALPLAAEETPAAHGGTQADLLSRLSLTSQSGPVNISSKELEFDYRTRTLTYRGNVEFFKELAARKSALQHLKGKLFKGSSELLFTHLVSDQSLSKEQIQRMKDLLAKMKEK